MPPSCQSAAGSGPKTPVPLRPQLEAVRLRELEKGHLGVVPEHVGSSGPPWRLRAAKHPSPRRNRMKLHGNAALSWQRQAAAGRAGRRRGLDAEGGGRGRRRQRALRAQVGRPLPPGGRGGPRRSLLGAAAGREPHAAGAHRGDRRAARLRMTAAEIAETLAMALSTVSGILRRLGLGRLGRLGLEQPRPLRALAAGRARARRRQAPGPDPGRRRQARPRRAAQALEPRPHRRRGPPPADRRLGVRARRGRRPLAPRLRRGAARREGDRRRSASCAGRSPSTRATGSGSSGC